MTDPSAGPPGAPAGTYRPDIDGLRAVAVLSVLFFHVGFPAFGGGFVGVDVFFVISGFLITRLVVDEIARSGRLSFSRFYIRRIRRLLPALFATLALTLAVSALLLAPSQVEMVARTTVSAMFSVSNFQFWSQIDYFNPEAQLNPLLHTWSLSVEEQFYFVWPATLLLLARAGRRWMVGAVAFVVVASLVASEWAVHAYDTAAYYLLPFRMFELALGALMVWGVRVQPRANGWREAIALAGLAMILWPVFTYTRETPFPGIHALLPCAGTALLIHSGQARWTGALLRNRVATWFGAISYSLYLVHWPIIVIYALWAFREPSTTVRWAMLVGSVALAAVFYRWVETPFRHAPARVAADPAAPARPNRPLLVGVALAAVVLLVPAITLGTMGGGVRASAIPPATMASLMRSRGHRKPEPMQLAAPVATVAVIGDSHSTRVLTGLYEWGAKNNVQFDHYLPAGGCPPLIGLAVFADTRQSTQCRSRRDMMLKKIAKGDADVVLLVGRWGLYTGEISPGDAIEPRHLSLDWDDRGDLGLAQSREAFGEGLLRTFSLLKRAKKRIVFVGQVPPLGRDPYPCLEVQPDLAAIDANCRSATYAEGLAETRWALDFARRFQVGRPQMVVFDPYETLCEGEVCRLTRGRDVLYSDGNHLSHAGSRELARDLGPVIGDVLGLPASTRGEHATAASGPASAR